MRTVLWFISFVVTLIGTIPKLWHVKSLESSSKQEECEKYIHQITSNWARGTIKHSGSTIQVHGIENIPQEGAVVFISNHQGNFDIPILISYIDKPKGFIAKIETLKIPIVRNWMHLIHCVFMDRSGSLTVT